MSTFIVPYTGQEVNNILDKVNNIAYTSEQVNYLLNEVALMEDASNIGTALSYGMNSKITNSGKTSELPKVTFTGQSYTNLLGKDGNCEDISKWGVWQSTLTLDTTNKMFANNGIKATISGTVGTFFRTKSTINIDNTKYYLYSAYLKNGNASDVRIGMDAQNVIVTDTTKFTRVGIITTPSQTTSATEVTVIVNGVATQYAYVDGVMVNEITATEYDLGVQALLTKYPYIDSYACLTNPYMEVKHDNLVRNGNGEESIGWWAGGTSAILTINNKKFQLVTTASPSSVYQKINVKPNTNYYLSGNVSGNTNLVVYDGSSITILKTGIGTFNSGAYSSITLYANNASIGTGTFDSIMLIEGTTSPSSYLTQRMERTVIEGNFTSDDTVTLENGKVSGLLSWKHRALYGKDYDWQPNSNYSDFYRFGLTLNVGVNNPNIIGVDYDGSVSKNQSNVAITSSAKGSLNTWSNGFMYVDIADTKTGFSQAILPNADEVKVAMNGWKAISNTGVRYIGWCSVVDGLAPLGAVIGIVSGSNIAGQNKLNITSMPYVVGDFISVKQDDGTWVGYTVSAIAGFQLTLNVNLIGSCTSSNQVMRTDNGVTTLLAWCKSNIAPNYQGYQIHHKPSNPEPITDVNTHIHGDIPKIDIGDNYVTIDSGMVLGEIANLWTDGSYYTINNPASGNTHPESNLKNKVNNIKTIYKNSIDNSTLWTFRFNSSTCFNGIADAYTLNANVDITATYTVDYKILSTQAPQVGTIASSYSQDIFTVVKKLEDVVENKQIHDSILDSLVDLSMYETQMIRGGGKTVLFPALATLYCTVTLSPKKVTPIITFSNLACFSKDAGGNSYAMALGSDYYIAIDNLKGNILTFGIYVTNSVHRTNSSTNGMFCTLNVTADCRGRV